MFTYLKKYHMNLPGFLMSVLFLSFTAGLVLAAAGVTVAA